MSLPAEKRLQVINYITELIGRGEPHLSSKVSETFGISRTTTSIYLRKLREEGMIERLPSGRGYRLKEKTFSLEQSLKGPFPSEDTLLEQFLPYIDGFPDQARRNFMHIFLEMMNNALEHSGASRVVSNLRVTPIEFRCSIIDDGIGIFERIREFFRKELNEEISLDDARLQLVSGGFTSDREKHGGEGIYNSSLIADSFAIFSSNKVFARDYEKVDPVSWDLKIPHQGTMVYFSVHRDTQKTLREAEHANPDDGFFRVTLPLRLMTLTGTALIARSQARRFAFNFADKKEVVLDFEGITELCQPFAHEIFKVYRKNHPDVRLITRNTTPEMDRLIQRLMSEE
ncbi:MAG: STAS-like domain-containing protein [Thermoguttaceae bacterium]